MPVKVEHQKIVSFPWQVQDEHEIESGMAADERDSGGIHKLYKSRLHSVNKRISKQG
ncbi:MAG: hypothetical protein P8Y24_12130 [Gammaproteobacteria bacterium]